MDGLRALDQVNVTIAFSIDLDGLDGSYCCLQQFGAAAYCDVRHTLMYLPQEVLPAVPIKVVPAHDARAR